MLLVSYDDPADSPKDYRDFVEEPRFKFHFCGRIAHAAETLCIPMDLQPCTDSSRHVRHQIHQETMSILTVR